MKKILVLSGSVLLSGLLLLSSCSKDSTTPTPQPPSLNIVAGTGLISGDATVEVNSTFSIKLAAFQNADSKKNLSTLKVSRTFTPQTKSANSDTTLDLGNLPSVEITLNFNAQPSVGSEIIEFVLTDKAGETASQSLKITTKVSITKYTDVELGSFNTTGTVPSFFATSTGEAMPKAVAANNLDIIDFCFLKSQVDQNNYMCAINDTKAVSAYQLSSWATQNATKFDTTNYTAAEFDSMTDDTYIAGITIADPQTDHSRVVLENGKVYSFITVAGKKGLIKVIDLYSRGDYAKFDIIVQN